MMVSLDGFVAGPDGDIGWIRVDRELHEFVNDQQAAIGTYLYGRRLYEEMNAYWPTPDASQSDHDFIAAFARIWQQMPKVVFSRTLDRVEGNARLVREDPAAEVARLKAQPGKDLSVGGPGLAASLLCHGLVDEVGLFLHPILLGSGTPMFQGGAPLHDLRLTAAHTFASGVTYLQYERDSAQPPAEGTP
jgi:dihydrofolate reductase